MRARWAVIHAPHAHASRVRLISVSFNRGGFLTSKWLLFAGAGVVIACAVMAILSRALVVQVSLPRADAIVVMAGAPVYFDRVAQAGRLFLDGRAPRILLTNDGVRGSWSRTLQRNPLYYERAILRLNQAGVPSSAVEVLPGRVTGTFEEASLISDFAREHAFTSLIVVTSDFHTRRAFWSVRRALQGAGIDVGVEPAASSAAWWKTNGVQAVFSEYGKLAYYLVHYR
jgi:uncharacterized SAM-binding protein YcdF (DUF218 family)